MPLRYNVMAVHTLTVAHRGVTRSSVVHWGAYYFIMEDL